MKLIIFFALLLCAAPCWGQAFVVESERPTHQTTRFSLRTPSLNGELPPATDGGISIADRLQAIGSAKQVTVEQSGIRAQMMFLTPADIVVNAGGNVQTAINNSVCGDSIKAEAGATFDGSFTLPNKSCTVSTPITITSTATLPNRRVGPADASLMPRFRTLGGSPGGVFITAANAGWWILDGLEMTDNAGSEGVNMLVDVGSNAAGPHNFKMDRCYLHQKETGTTYTRSVRFAMQFEGVGLTYTRNYIEDFIGYPYGGDTLPHTSHALLSVSGQQILMEDNYLSAHYAILFLGGGDTAPTQTATLTSASTTSATFSNTTGLSIGQFIRFSVVGVATLSNAGNTPTLTRTSGEAWVTDDGITNANYGDSMFIRSVASPDKSGILRLMNLTGNNVFTSILGSSAAAEVPNGSVDYEIYQSAKITNIAGNVVTYDPTGTTNGIAYGINSLNHVPATAAWTVGDQGRVVDVTVRRNTLFVNPVFAVHLRDIGRGTPKGAFEIKSVDRFLWEGNTHLGYPAVLGFTAANQAGGSPWVTVDHLTIRRNLIRLDTGYPENSRGTFIVADDAYLNTITPTTTALFEDNLIVGGIRGFGDLKNGGLWTVRHNTILNGQGSTPGPNALVATQETTIPELVFKDNIGHVVCTAFSNYPTAYPVRTILNNVWIDADSGCSGGVNVNTYGTGSGLSPIAANDAAVGFVDLSACLAGNVLGCALAPGSPYKSAASDGTDPGANITTLSAALSSGGAAVTTAGKVIVSGRVTLQD